jgi:hypothetical protein
MLCKVIILCKILTLYVNFLVISLYTYNIFNVVIFIEVYFEKYFHLSFWKGLFIHENKFNTNYNMFKKLYEYCHAHIHVMTLHVTTISNLLIN